MNKYILKKPFFCLAPMANITTYPFASQAVKFGADLVWTPMVHTDTIINNWPEAEKILNFKEIEGYLVQIVGQEPNKFTESIKIIGKHLKPKGVDLNFACPDKNIIKSGCGGSLMQKPDLMFEIAKAAKSATNLPVSVKIRAGWDNTDQIFEIAPEFEKLGVKMLTVHPRTVKQLFRDEADWKVLKKLRKVISIPLVGSGDIKSWKDALEKQEETAVDGVMIGRAALGKPWIFKEIGDKKDYSASLNEIKALTLDLAEKANDIWGEKGITESKKHFAWYFRGFDGASDYRKKLMAANTIRDIEKTLK